MPTIKITLPKLHRAQIQIKTERKRRNVIDCGRRFGKNILLQDLAVETGLGTRSPIGWGAPIFKQTLDDYRNLDNILAPVITRRSISEMRLELSGGGSIEFWSLDKPDSIRGKKYRRFIVNEAGLVPNLLDIRNFIIMPTLIDYQGDEYYAGTPKGMNGFFALYNMTGEDWARWQMPSYANPHILRSELDGLKDTMTERAYQQEIMAQFLDDGGGVFRGVRAVATLDPAEPTEGGQYVIGVDWGRSNDATVFSVIDVHGSHDKHGLRLPAATPASPIEAVQPGDGSCRGEQHWAAEHRRVTGATCSCYRIHNHQRNEGADHPGARAGI
jgi:hypothetical protein